jgi:hypothetical protein
MASTGALFQLNSGLTSAPRLPQALQMNRGSRLDSLSSPGHRSALTEWLEPRNDLTLMRIIGVFAPTFRSVDQSTAT